MVLFPDLDGDSVFKISKMADYGTLLMTQLAARPGDIHNVTELSASSGLSAATVSKLLKMLARHELLTSFRGSKGGYQLARPAVAISVAEIIEAIEGALSITECAQPKSACEIQSRCQVQSNWRLITRAISTALDAISLADMVASTIPENLIQPLRPLADVKASADTE